MPRRSQIALLLLALTSSPVCGSESTDVLRDTAGQDTAGWVRGKVTDRSSGEPLKGATIAVAGTEYRCATDSAGYYQIALPPGRYDLEAQWGPHRKRVESVLVLAGLRVTTDLRIDCQSPYNNVVYDSIMRIVQASKPVEVNVRRAGYDRVLAKAWNVWVNGRGRYAIKQTRHSIEGDPFTHYLIIRDGHCLDVNDSRRDEMGRTVTAREMPELRLEYHASPHRPPDGRPRNQWVRLVLIDDEGETMGSYYGK
jgi:hypothetical protein